MTGPAGRAWWRDRRRGILTGAIVAILLWMFIGGSDGLYRHARMRMEIADLRQSNEILTQQNAELRRQIDSLTSNLDYIERVARERYGMAKPGERVYRIIPPAEER